MGLEQAEARSRLRRFQDVCRRSGVKVTHQRILIFQAVAGTDQHPDADTVFKTVREQAPTVALDTVYRTLWLLKDLGLISTLGPPRERVRFDANTSRHHHFVCVRCGLAKDFHSPEFDDLPVSETVKAIGQVQLAHVELRGLCSRCLKQEAAENSRQRSTPQRPTRRRLS